MADAASNVLDTTDREITSTRTFNAPRELVWKMWTEPEHIVKWWGPNGFTTTIHKMDVQPGGEWNFIMHGPDGTDYLNKCTYIEVAPPKLLIYDHVSGPKFRMHARFEDRGNTTEIAIRMLFDSAELRNKVAAEFGAVEGLNQTLGRLATYVEEIAA